VYQRRRARILLAVLVVAALVLITVDFRSGEDGPIDRLRGVASTVFRPFQDGVSTIVAPISNVGSNISELFSIRADNHRLREQVDRLQERRRSVTDLERENAQLRELLALHERDEMETVAARVVALAPSNFEWTLTIDVGAEHGVEPYMPVISGQGLVGRVYQVEPHASRVLLAIDPTFSAAVRTADTGEVGTIDGRGGEPMSFRALDPDAELEPGDEVVTSSYEGGVFPGGIPVGTIAEVDEDSSRLAREATVWPYVDFTRLHHVMVLLHREVEDLAPFDDADLPDLLPLPDEDPPDGEDAPDGEEGEDEDADDDAGDDDTEDAVEALGRADGDT
jgi:rod shape-determining protein MreC